MQYWGMTLSIVRQLDDGNVSEDMIDYLALRLDQKTQEK